MQGVTLGEKLGEGGFGIVWKAALQDGVHLDKRVLADSVVGTEVAVKELKVPQSGLSAAEREEKFQVRHSYVITTLISIGRSSRGRSTLCQT